MISNLLGFFQDHKATINTRAVVRFSNLSVSDSNRLFISLFVLFSETPSTPSTPSHDTSEYLKVFLRTLSRHLMFSFALLECNLSRNSLSLNWKLPLIADFKKSLISWANFVLCLIFKLVSLFYGLYGGLRITIFR